MPFTVTMPKLSPTMEEGTVAKWFKKEGDLIESGDLLFEITTDKATLEHHALDKGYLRKILIQEGQKALVNEPLAIMSEKENETLAGFEIQKEPPPAPVAKREQPKPEAPTKMPSRERPLASPLARHMAQQQGIDLFAVKGTGPHGRIMSRDLVHAAPAPKAVKEAPLLQARQEKLAPLAQIIADKMSYAKSTIPHFYGRKEVNVEKLVELRGSLKDAGQNVTINDFIIKAVAIALKNHPEMNVCFDSEKGLVTHFDTIDICVAVTVHGGISTPVIRQADTKSLKCISAEVKELAARAKESKLLPEEYLGGSFTISNLGMFGITSFDSIINPPQGAILAVGTIEDKPVVKNGACVPGKVVCLTVSCDHRIIDGTLCAAFLKTLSELLENPILFLAE